HSKCRGLTGALPYLVGRMSERLCGLCFHNFSNLKQHLKVSHTIQNKEEFQLLMRYGNSRTSKYLECKICGKRNLVRLDKHLQIAHNIGSAEEREPIMRQAKRAVIVKMLAELRESSPDVPMVSSLDLGVTMEHEEFVLPIGEIIEEAVSKELREEPEGLEYREEEEASSINSSSNNHLATGIHSAFQCSTPIIQRQDHDYNMSSSSDLPEHTGQLLFSTPVSGAQNSSASNQIPSTALCASMPPPSCETVMSFNLPGHLSGHSEHLTGSMSRDRMCYCEQLDSRVQQLEKKVDSLMAMQQQTPILTKAPLSVQKSEHVGKGKKGACFFEKAVEDFFKFRLGPRTGRKDRENARQCSSHAFRFCLYMAGGLPSKIVSSDLRFLNQMDKLRGWPTYLVQKGYAPSSMKNMLTNVIMFFKHIENSFLTQSKLKQNEINKILYELKRIQAEIQRTLVVHRQKVLRRKTDDQLHATQESAFMTAARENIPKLFERLESSGNQENEHSKLMGYIMGYLCILTGHRSVVLTNMTKENVVNFVCWNHGKRFQVLVDDHKTMQSFGQAAFNLNEEEFRWLENLANCKCSPQGQASDYVFHTTLGKQIGKAGNFLHLAWVDCGMKGTISFNKIRSSVSTQANQYLSEKERKQVAKAMCHDPSTAERFYVALPDKVTGYETRRLRLKALKMAIAKPSEEDEKITDTSSDDTPETSTEDEEPIYDDHESVSSLSSEELRIMRQRRGRPSKARSRARITSSYEVPTSSQDSLPPAQPLKSKRKLDFLTEESAEIHIYTPSKCAIVVEKLHQPIAEYYLFKANLSNALPGQAPLADPKNLPAQSARFLAAPTAQEEPSSEPEPLTAKTTDYVSVPATEQVPGNVPAPLIPLEQTPDWMLETQEEKNAQTSPGLDPVCVLNLIFQETPELVPETPEDQMPQTQAEDVQKS
ncbi:uncharacterized protein LOC119891063, partial [Micropterus salmoides]|uniref:uncharacterized protein LOC119884013 n=1 Tax=Micropterus salmoides TaxID=27706 RepID=UPI0018EAB69D